MQHRIGIIGLGYVGLPLAIALAQKYPVNGYDTNKKRIKNLQAGIDDTNEFTADELSQATINYYNAPQQLKNCNIYIVTVPTPLNAENLPDFSYLENASITLSKLLNKGDIVVYESTVYPGATEEICVPLLEKSSLLFNQDFFVGYSPERINVGDKTNTFTSIPKIVSASNKATLEVLTQLYQSVITAEVYKAPSIRVAEAAKVIENTQRDVNIAFVNELAMMFNAMGLDTQEVLKAASTKWNFLNFSPGLVGGHCIGIDPYYLAHKSKALGYSPELLLSARKINEEVPHFLAQDIAKKIKAHQIEEEGAKVLLLGATFKENTPDLRNSKAVTLAQALNEKGLEVLIYDPYIESAKIEDMEVLTAPPQKQLFDVVILAVPHQAFKSLDPLEYLTPKGFGYDIKAFFELHPRIYRL